MFTTDVTLNAGNSPIYYKKYTVKTFKQNNLFMTSVNEWTNFVENTPYGHWQINGSVHRTVPYSFTKIYGSEAHFKVVKPIYNELLLRSWDELSSRKLDDHVRMVLGQYHLSICAQLLDMSSSFHTLI